MKRITNPSKMHGTIVALTIPGELNFQLGKSFGLMFTLFACIFFTGCKKDFSEHQFQATSATSGNAVVGYPSRLALYTGKYNFRNYTKWGEFPPTEKTIGNMLHDAGYATCFVGRWQCDGGDARIRSAGFDNYRAFQPFAMESYVYQYSYKNPLCMKVETICLLLLQWESIQKICMLTT